MIFFFYGADTWRSRQKVNEIRDKFVREVDPTGTNVHVLDGPTLTIERWRNAVVATGFFATKRLIIVRDPLRLKKADVLEQVLAVLDQSSVMADAIIVFWEQGPADKRTTIYRRLAAEKYTQEYEPLDDAAAEHWLAKEFAARGGQISREALPLLQSRVGSDLWRANQEIDKLLAHCAGRQIEIVDIEQLVTGTYDDLIFQFVDAVAAGNRREAHRLLDSQIKSGSHELYLLTMIARQFRLLIAAADLAEQGMSERAAASTLGVHPFVAKKTLALSRRFSLPRLAEIYSAIVETDYAIKTSQADPRVLLEVLVEKIAQSS